MYKCKYCGHIFHMPATVEEYRGEYWGFPSYEKMQACPKCGWGDIMKVEAHANEKAFVWPDGTLEILPEMTLADVEEW